MQKPHEKKRNIRSKNQKELKIMKIAIASNGNTLESNLDKSFGRCAYFIIYDKESKAVEYIPNPNKDMEENAGPASVELVADRKSVV